MIREKIKVLSYIFRQKQGVRELLVFVHRDVEAGIQVVGGTLDQGEDFKEAMVRELYEESGLLALSSDCSFIGESIYYRQDIVEKNVRHYFEIYLANLPDSWSHTVESHGQDNHLVFDFFWLPVEEAKRVLVGNMGEFL